MAVEEPFWLIIIIMGCVVSLQGFVHHFRFGGEDTYLVGLRIFFRCHGNHKQTKQFFFENRLTSTKENGEIKDKTSTWE